MHKSLLSLHGVYADELEINATRIFQNLFTIPFSLQAAGERRSPLSATITMVQVLVVLMGITWTTRASHNSCARYIIIVMCFAFCLVCVDEPFDEGVRF